MRASEPICPHCGYEFDEDDIWYSSGSTHEVSTGDGDESIVTCPGGDCGEKFKISCVHEIKFESETLESWEE